MSRLDRFKTAQAFPHAGFHVALKEIRGGRKRSHWIWYVFPQLAGLGSSSMSRAYAIEGRAEASEFLHDDELRSRLSTIAQAVLEQLRVDHAPALRDVMGSEIDAQKLVSSMTLFGQVAKEIAAEEPTNEYESLAKTADEILTIANAQGYPPCERTQRQLEQSQ
jgi:uncharacterized protein (DUF1810 family)